MSRPIRIQYPNALYHITSRGNARNKIYLNQKDYHNFLNIFEEVIQRYNWIVYAYCLMPNHYHILIKTPVANLTEGMRQLNGVYTQKFNYWHKKVGHLFQGRYKAILVEGEEYLGELFRYIALNPVKAKLVQRPDAWKWSSYTEIVGKTKTTKCVDIKLALAVFDNNHVKAKKELKKFVNEKNTNDIWEDLKGGFLLGSLEFANEIKQYFINQKDTIEIPKKERLAHRPELKNMFLEIGSSKEKRNKTIHKAYFEYGYSLSEIGRALKLHYSAISKIIKK